MIRFAENLNKMIEAGLGGAMEAPSTEVAVGHRVRYMDASGAVATFETNVAAPIRSLRIDMLPIQAGSGDPSPDNIRPITGRNSVTVTRTGKNLFPNPSGARSAVDLKAGVEYCFSANGASSAVVVSGKYADGTTFPTLFLNKVSGNIRYNSRVLEKDVSEIVIYLNGVTLYDCQIEVGSTATDYAPFDGASVTVQLGQTVYGGTVDVTGGGSKVTYARIDLSTLTWAYVTGYNEYGFFLSSIVPGMVTEGRWNGYCSAYPIVSKDVSVLGDKEMTNIVGGARLRIVNSDYGSDATSFKASLNGVDFVYPLITPAKITTDPVTLSTLRGDNTVWSDAGDVTLEYPYYEETEGY